MPYPYQNPISATLGAGASPTFGNAGPSSAASRSSNNVNIGAPTFTTRPTAGGNIANLIDRLPTIGIVAAAGIGLYLALR